MQQSVVQSWLPGIIVLLPLVASPIIYLAACRSWRIRNAISLVASGICTVLMVSAYPVVTRGQVLVADFPAIMPPLGISFRICELSLLLGAITSFIWFMATLYSVHYMEHEHCRKRFYSSFILALSGCMGVFLSGDLFTLFLFFELMSLSAYVLVVHEETVEAIRAGYKYLIMTIIGGLGIFLGIAITHQITGTLSFFDGPMFAAHGLSGLSLVAFFGFLLGFGIKGGIVPLHVWLPDAHPVAPSPASAILSGLMIKTGAYGLIRVIYDVFGRELIAAHGWANIIFVLGIVTILLGSAVALVQDDLKRRLAYSSVGQMGYIMVALSMLSVQGMVGAIFHIFSHAFMKSTLFLCAGSIIHRTGTRSIKELSGVGIVMPFTMAAFTLAALGMIGVPPMNAFVSKWQISMGALAIGRPYVILVLLVSSLLNMCYYMPISISAFFGARDKSKDLRMNEAPWTMLVPVLILALANVVFNLIPENVALRLTEAAARLFFQ